MPFFNTKRPDKTGHKNGIYLPLRKDTNKVRKDSQNDK